MLIRVKHYPYVYARNGGGVGIIWRNDWKIKKLVSPHNAFECFSVEISPVKDQHFYAAAVYHPPNPTYCPDNLIEFLKNAKRKECSLKIFWRSMPPEPPSLQYIRRSNLSFCAYTFKTSRYAPDPFLNEPKKKEFIKTRKQVWLPVNVIPYLGQK